MRKKLMSLWDVAILKITFIIETVNDKLKRGIPWLEEE